MTDYEARTGEQPVERGASEEGAGAPLTQTEVDASRRPPSAPGTGDDLVTEDDGSGSAGGSSGGSGGGSTMPGHPDAA
jgi:hypothetical protein